MRTTKTKELSPCLLIMFRKKSFYLIVLVTIVIFTSVYFKYYYINMKRFNYAIGVGAFESIDGNYRIDISIYPVGDFRFMEFDKVKEYLKQGEIEAFVIGRLYWNPTIQQNVKTWDGQYSKIVFYDKYDGTTISVKWIDELTLNINGVMLKIPNQTFDYRRTWEIG